MRHLHLHFFLLCLLLAACAGAPQVEKRKVAGAKARETLIYDYTQFDYTYARAIALERTNLEPAPTSYVLFPVPLGPEDRQRVEAYCLKHYEHFKDLGDVYEADPYGNVVTFYWPTTGSDDEVREALRTEDSAERCRFLEEHYDYRRAKALLETLEAGAYRENRGPVLVLDLGFDAVVVPYDNVKTEFLERIPPMWKQAIDDALSHAKKSLKEMLDELKVLDSKIADLEAATQAPNTGKKELKIAKEQLAETQGQRGGLVQRLFGKSSLGRLILCGFSRALMPKLLSKAPLEAKVTKWCAAEEPSGTD